MADSVETVLVTFEKITLIESADVKRPPSGTVKFRVTLGSDGNKIEEDLVFPMGTDTLNLPANAWQKSVDVRGKRSFVINVDGYIEELVSQSLGGVQHAVEKDRKKGWPDKAFEETAKKPAAFKVKYRVEPTLSLDPAKPETALVCRQHLGQPTCSTLSGVSVKVVKIKATVPSCPPETLRAGAVANNWPAPVDLTFESTKQLPTGPFNKNNDNATFAKPDALVVMRHGPGPIKLEAETQPANTKVTFKAYRSVDDGAKVGKKELKLKQTGATTAEMPTNQRGSFYVLAFLDKNGNGDRDDNEQGIMLPVIMVEAKVEKPKRNIRSVGNPGNVDINFDGTAGKVEAANYTYVMVKNGDFNSAATALVSFEADVVLVGGGSDGRRGLDGDDRVHLGWANHFRKDTWHATYSDKKVTKIFYVGNTTDAGRKWAGLPVFIAADPAPTVLNLPLMDTGRRDPQKGGQNVLFTSSAETVSAPNPALGQKRNVKALDSPGGPYARVHPDPGNASTLTQFVTDFESETMLVAWTNTKGGGAPLPGTPNAVGFRTFTVIAMTKWTMKTKYKLEFSGGKHKLKRVQKPRVKVKKKGYSPGKTPAALNYEMRPPTMLKQMSVDAR